MKPNSFFNKKYNELMQLLLCHMLLQPFLGEGVGVCVCVVFWGGGGGVNFIRTRQKGQVAT